MKRFRLLFVLMMAIAAMSCGKDKKDTSDKEIVEKIVAKNAGTGCICEPYLNKYTFKGKITYAMLNKGAACNSTVLFFDAIGTVFELPAGVTFHDFFAEATFVEQSWTCAGVQPHN